MNKVIEQYSNLSVQDQAELTWFRRYLTGMNADTVQEVDDCIEKILQDIHKSGDDEEIYYALVPEHPSLFEAIIEWNDKARYCIEYDYRMALEAEAIRRFRKEIADSEVA